MGACISSRVPKKRYPKTRWFRMVFVPPYCHYRGSVCLSWSDFIMLGKNFHSMCFLTVCGYDELCTSCPVRWPLCYFFLFSIFWNIFFKSIYFFCTSGHLFFEVLFRGCRTMGANEYSWLSPTSALNLEQLKCSFQVMLHECCKNFVYYPKVPNRRYPNRKPMYTTPRKDNFFLRWRGIYDAALRWFLQSQIAVNEA